VFSKDGFPGEFLTDWKAVLKTGQFDNVDISQAFAYIIASKDEHEINNIRKAALVSVEIFNKYLKDQIMDVIDSDKVCFHLNSH